MTELTVHPATGEALDLAAQDTESLAGVRHDVNELEYRLRGLKRDIDRELHRRMDAEVRWSVRAGDFEVRGASPDRIDYPDAAGLRAALMELSERRDVIGHEDAIARAVEEVTSYKINRAELNRLRKLQVYRDVIDRFAVPVDPETRRASVTRVRNG